MRSKEDSTELRPSTQLQVLFAVRGDIWVELTDANLEYVRDAMRNSQPFDQPISKRAKPAKP